LPADNPMFEAWREVGPTIYGAQGKELFPGVNCVFEVVSPQELKCHQEITDTQTLDAWVSYVTSADLSPATDIHDALEIMYPGESVTQTLEIINAPAGVQDSTAYQWVNEDPKVSVIQN